MKNDITYEYRVFTNRLIDIEHMEVGKCTSKIIKEIKPKDKVDGRFFHTSDTDEWFFCWKGELQKLNLKGNADVNSALDEVKKLIGDANTAVNKANAAVADAAVAAENASVAAASANKAVETIDNKIAEKADVSDVETISKAVDTKADKTIVEDLIDRVDGIKVPSLEGYATEKFVGDAIAEINIPTVPTKVSDLENDVNYLTEQSLDGYATEKWVGEQGYLTEIPTDYLTKDAADKLYAPFGSTGSGSVDTTEFVKEAELADKLADMGYATQDWVEERGYITEDTLASKGYATTTQVEAKQDVIDDLASIRANSELGATALQEVPAEYVTETELAGMNYATVEQVNAKQDVIGDLSAIRANAEAGAAALEAAKADAAEKYQEKGAYVTESWVGEQGYLTAGDIENKYALQSYVSEQIARIDGLIGEATNITNNILS